jgi:hypothetical protein
MMTHNFLSLFARDQSMCDFLLQKVPAAPCLYYLMGEIIGHGSINSDLSARFIRVWRRRWEKFFFFFFFNFFDDSGLFGVCYYSVRFIHFFLCHVLFSTPGLLCPADAEILS